MGERAARPLHRRSLILRDDYIQRQVAALAAFVAKLLRKPRTAEEAAAEAQASGLVGLDLDDDDVQAVISGLLGG